MFCRCKPIFLCIITVFEEPTFGMKIFFAYIVMHDICHYNFLNFVSERLKNCNSVVLILIKFIDNLIYSSTCDVRKKGRKNTIYKIDKINHVDTLQRYRNSDLINSV